MPDEIASLVIEPLCAIRAKLDSMANDTVGRLERIERRMDLSDA
jgi:hypothetical protein